MAYLAEADMQNAVSSLDDEENSPEEQAAKDYADSGGKPINGQVPSDILSGMQSSITGPASSSSDGATVSKKNLFATLYPDVVAAGEEVQRQAASQETNLNALYQQNALDVQNTLDRIGQRGDATAAVSTAQASLDSSRGQDASLVLGRLSINDSDLQNTIATIMSQKRDTVDQLTTLQQDLSQKLSAIPAFTDNPLGWLVGHLAVKGEINQHNALLQYSNQLSASAESLTHMADEVIGANAPKYATQLASVALAQADAAVAEANEQKARVQQQATLTNTGFQKPALQRALDVYNVKREGLALAERAASSEDSQAAREGQMQLRQAKAAADDAQLEALKETTKFMGWQPINSLQEYNKMPLAQKKAIDTVQNSQGEQIGPDLTSTMQIMSQGSPSRMALNSQTLLKATMSEWNASKQSLPQSFLAEFPKPQQQNDEIEKRTYQKFLDMQSKIGVNPVEGQQNIYSAPPASRIVSDPVFAQTTLAGLLKTTAEQNPNVPINDSQVIGAVKQELAKGPAGAYGGSIEKASQDLTTYYQTAKKINNSTFNFDAWHLPSQKIYKLDGLDRSDYKTNALDLSKSLINPNTPFGFELGMASP